jgi:DNA repair photolyase
MLSDRNLWTPDNVRVADIDTIKRKIESYLDGKGNGIVAKVFQNRIPARLGGLTDCFQPIEESERVTLQLIRYLNSIHYPYLIVTKSDLVSDHSYLKEFRQDLAYVQITITTLNTDIASKLESNAPLPERRINAIRKLNEAGIYSAGRLSPIIPNITNEDCFRIIERLEEINVPHTIFEAFRGNSKIVKRVENATGLEVKPLQKRGVYYRFTLLEKQKLYRRIGKNEG